MLAHEDIGEPNDEARQEGVQQEDEHPGRPEGAEQEEAEQGEASFKFKYACPSGCGAIFEYEAKPCRILTGDWPKARCVACGIITRIRSSAWCCRRRLFCMQL